MYPSRVPQDHRGRSCRFGRLLPDPGHFRVGRCAGPAFKNACEEAAWHSFYEGIGMLEGTSPRADVLARWQGTLRTYPGSRYHDQLVDLITELTKQVEEDKKLAAAEPADPGKLPLPERIDYYMARFPDVRGFQWSQPGVCQTTGMSDGTNPSDAIVKIGRSAVPALIEHLSDRRLTRAIGYWRSFHPSREVLRVQDVAVECIQEILQVRFYERSSTSSYLSNENPGVRDAVIAKIKAWWKDHGDEPPVTGLEEDGRGRVRNAGITPKPA